MQTISRTTFTTIKTEGALLPADLLQRIAEGQGVEGLRPEDYHLLPGERLNEAINRAWNRCLGAWQIFDAQRARLPETERGTTLTRERWLLILFQELGYGRLQYIGSLPVDGEGRASKVKNQTSSVKRQDDASPLTFDVSHYPISHCWEHTPIHLVSFRDDLERRGAEKRSAHSLMQEFLNRAEGYVWGMVSNGLRLRILRDNASLTRAAYVEFDLEAMMAGELYADFALLWLVCHQSRVESPPFISPASGGDRGGECWLERWSKSAAEQGVRALGALRDGVQEAISALGRGFLAHPANRALKAKLCSGELGAQDYYRQLLRLVYRMIFLFAAEDRELLLVDTMTADGRPATVSDQPSSVSRQYQQYYSARRLREMAGALRGGPHADLYRSLRLTFVLLRDGYPALGLPALGSFLFSERATPDLDSAELPNSDLLASIRALAFTIEGKVRRPVDYKNLGSIELGSVYESLLELHPQLNADAASFDLQTGAGNERKTTGSHYTHPDLVNELIESALEPVIQARLECVTRQASNVNSQTSNVNSQPLDVSRLTFDSAEQAILSIKLCDSACGSGHFLVAGAYRLARRLAQVRTGDEEPTPAAIRTALRDVVGRCIYGVDINPMAVELCKVSLWLEALEPGKPLSFLDHHIQCGNSLIGATPALLKAGIPDEAFTPIEGDDKKICAEFKKKNKAQRAGGQMSLFAHDLQPWERLGDLATSLTALDDMADGTLEDVRRKQERYEQVVRSSEYEYGYLWADAWCAAFVWKKTAEFAYPITEEVFRQIERNPFSIPVWMRDEIKRLSEQYQFFHWHLAFPDVFLPGDDGGLQGSDGRPTADDGGQMSNVKRQTSNVSGLAGGFDCMLGNPPWERIKLQEKEWFATRRPEIANAPNAAQRRKLIEALAQDDQALYAAFLDDRRKAEGESHFVRQSGRYPLCGRGDVNTYAVFAELSRALPNPLGRVGIIVPSGIATDDTTKFFFRDLMDTGALVSLYDFENREGLFPDVHRSFKFCLLTLAGEDCPTQSAEFVFFAHRTSDLQEAERRFSLSAAEIALLNPNTRTCPIFRSKRDAELTKAIYRCVPVLVDESGENPWEIRFFTVFHMANDSSLFRTREQLEVEGGKLVGNRFILGEDIYLPLYEAKMANMFDHRAAHVVISDTAVVRQGQPERITIEEHADPSLLPIPRYWVNKTEVLTRIGDYALPALLGFTDVTSSTNERTMLASILPIVGVGHTMPLVLPSTGVIGLVYLAANLNSFVFDYVGRQKVGGLHYTYFILKQLPVLLPAAYEQPCPWLAAVGGQPSAVTYSAFIVPRALELTYTAWDLQPFAKDCGYAGPPFRWDEERRFLLRCELDAAYFHLYGIARDDVDYIMDTFPIVRRKDEAAHGEYRTKRVILEIYDAMQRAKETGGTYQTLLDPPPADARVAHEPR